MKSRASLAALALIASPAIAQSGAVAPDEPRGAGPRGSSEPAAGERRFDATGRAGVSAAAGMGVSAPGLTPGGFAEVTAIDSGRTIVAVVGEEPVPAGRIALLTPDAAHALGVEGEAAVRIRPAMPTGPEIAALRAGRPITRADAPPALLVALRKRLGPTPRPVAAAAPVAKASKPAPPAARPAPKPAVAPRGLAPGVYVQFAALSSPERAQALAVKVGGLVERSGALYRVQRGPFATAAAAQAERSRAATLGYPDARIVKIVP